MYKTVNLQTAMYYINQPVHSILVTLFFELIYEQNKNNSIQGILLKL